MNRILLVVFVLCFLSACNTRSKTQNSGETVSDSKIADSQERSLPESFELVITESRENVAAGSITLFVEINQKLTKVQLQGLSDRIKSEQKFSRVFINYTLPQNSTGTAWASVEYNPNFKLDINGSTIEEERKIIAMVKQIDGNIMGCWYEEEYTSSTKVLYEKENQTYLRTFRKKFNSDEIVSDDVKVSMIKHAQGTKLTYKNEHGEYYVMSGDNQKLMFFNSDGNNFTTALPLKADFFDTKNSARNKALEIKGNTAAVYTMKEANKDMAKKVYIISQEFIKQRLQNSQSANFSDEYRVEDMGNDVYRIVVSVSVKNDLGQDVNLQCKYKLKFKGGAWENSSNWSVLDSEIL